MTRPALRAEGELAIVPAPVVVPGRPAASDGPARTPDHPVRRVARIAGGWALVVVGAALIPLPGPGLLVVAGGLALLATEYAWAARLLRTVRERIDAVRRRATRTPRDDDAAPREPTCGS